MTLAALTKLEKLLIDNSPAVLTAIGVTGVVTTAVLTGKASIKAVELIKEANEKDDVHDLYMPARERFDLTWKLYIPAVGSGLLTCAAIIGANRIGTRRAAGIAAAFTLSERAYDEYKSKVVEKLGPDKERALRDELAQERVDRNPGGSQIIITGTKVLCYDSYTGRYFESSMTEMQDAQNKLNVEVINNQYASLSDLYNLLGIPKTSASDELGWTPERLLDMKFSTVLSEDGRPCISVDYHLDAVRDYWRNNH